MDWHFDNTLVEALHGLYHPWSPAPVADPKLVVLNDDLAHDLGLDPDYLGSDDGVAALSGAALPAGSHPVALAYAGHQFGQFNPFLGDGRALLVGEIVDPTGRRRDLALKGSGRTPFSRGGDGRLQLGPALREYLMGEALHALGVPTTRALAVITTGEQVARPTGVQPGAVLVRIAASHLRVGTIEWARFHGTIDDVSRVADYVISRHYSHLHAGDHDELLSQVVSRQAQLVAQWMAIGFIHGVMNTDNMTLSGETIDYGPCAFLDTHSPHQVFSSIDHHGRYAYGQQPTVAAWNLARLAEALLPVLSGIDDATARVQAFFPQYRQAVDEQFSTLAGISAEEAFQVLDGHDHASTMRRLGGHRAPAVIARNHLVEAALNAAVAGDMDPFQRLLVAVRSPFDEPLDETLTAPPPPGFTDTFMTYCGT